MGLSSSKRTTKSNQTATVAPSAQYQPNIDSAAAALQPSFQAAQANTAALLPRVNSVMDYYGNTLSQPLTSNPYLQKMIDSSNDDIENRVDSTYSQAGRYGSGYHTGVLAKSLADNENQYRYQDYTTQQGRQDQAAQGLLGSVGVSAALPQAAASEYAQQVRALLGGYTTGTQSGTNVSKETPSIMSILAQMSQNVGSAAKAAG